MTNGRLPFNIACGFCSNCLRGYTGAFLTVNAAPHAAYGYADMGPFKGGQAEYLRVPYADFNALKPPGTPGDQWEDDYVTLSPSSTRPGRSAWPASTCPRIQAASTSRPNRGSSRFRGDKSVSTHSPSSTLNC